jgi:polysaccharide biosynthesis/export protein
VWNLSASWVSRKPRNLGVLLLVLATVAVACFSQVAKAADGVGRLVPGDQITVTVFGQTDLSGTFQIDGKGFIELPLVGALMVKQLTPQECEKLITGRLADGYLNRPVVSVRIGEVRPIYVLGDVRTPGAYAFRHGATVLSAIAQAGGYGVDVGGTVSDFLLADERVRTLESTRHGLLIRQARLEAQRDGQTTFTPPGIPTEQQDKQAPELIANEREALRAQITALNEELALHRSQKPRLEQAYTSIEQQIATEVKQSQLVQTQLADLEQLSSKGLSMRSREIALQRERAGMESNISRYRSELARLAVTIGEVDIKINEANTLYRRRVLGELDDVRRKMQEIDAAMPSAKEMRDVRSQQAANSAGVGSAPPNYRIVLRRTVENELKIVNAAGEAPLEPGDVVEVKRLRPEGIAGSGAAAIGGSTSHIIGAASGGAVNGGGVTAAPIVEGNARGNTSGPANPSATGMDLRPSGGTTDSRAQRSSLADGKTAGPERTR